MNEAEKEHRLEQNEIRKNGFIGYAKGLHIGGFIDELEFNKIVHKINYHHTIKQSEVNDYYNKQNQP